MAVNPRTRTASAGVKSKVEDRALVDRRRRQIVNAAIERFGKRGYHATTISDIAQRAGVSVGLIYQYFGDKEDVLFLAILEVLDSYLEQIPSSAGSSGDPLERFRAAVHAYCRVIDANVDATVLAYRETKSLRKVRRNLIKQKEHETNALIAACISDCIRAGLFEKIDIELLTYQIVMFAHAWALKAWHFRGKMSVGQYVDRGLAVMLNRVLTPRGQRERAPLRAR
ncbi:MAG: TetR family transcriptional regulator [Betaproteobacteria bacterium]|nr:TetR family transcriptional regulator [Betaproteobacteria bacterium]